MGNIVSDLNIKPYYDTTQYEVEKGYSKFLAVEDRVLQNRELNIIQGLIQGNVKKITDLIIENASISSGCSFIKSKDTKQCILTAGEIYFNGLIINVNEYIWDFNEVPDELCDVYLEVYMQTIDEIDDPSLYDPAEVYENHGQPGGHRLKYFVTPKILPEKSFDILKTEKKNIVHLMKIFKKELYGPTQPKPIFGKLYNMLAQRTYDSMGDFLSHGLIVKAKKNENNSSLFYNINISPGRAYIKGFEYNYEKDITIIFKGATDTKSCGLANPIGPDVNTYSAGTLQYRLSRENIISIDHVNALISQEGISLVFDPITKVNNLPSYITGIYSIDEVYDYSGEGSTKKTYLLATDYSIEASNTSIIWKTDGSYPQGTFYIDITITRELLKENYQLYNENNISYIKFFEGSMKPKNGTNFNVSYTWLLSRIDLVYLTGDGFLRVKAGIPNEYINTIKPSIPAGALPLAYIYIKPNIAPEFYYIDSFDIYRVPVIQLQTMKKKINDFEYNFAMSELEKMAQNSHIEKDSITTLKNIFTDAIVSYNKIDLYHPEFDANIDLYRSEVTLPFKIDHVTKDEINVTNENNEIIIKDNPITLDIIGTTIADNQNNATHHKDVAPYIFKAMAPTVILSPKLLVHTEHNIIDRIIWLPNRLVYSSKTVEQWVTRNVSTTTSDINQIISTTPSTPSPSNRSFLSRNDYNISDTLYHSNTSCFAYI